MPSHLPPSHSPPSPLPTAAIASVSHGPSSPSLPHTWTSPLVQQVEVKRMCASYSSNLFRAPTISITYRWHVIFPCLAIGPLLCLIACIPGLAIRRKAMRSRRTRDAKKRRVGPASQHSRTASSTRTESSTAATADGGQGVELRPRANTDDTASVAAAGHVSFSEPESRLSRPPSPTPGHQPGLAVGAGAVHRTLRTFEPAPSIVSAACGGYVLTVCEPTCLLTTLPLRPLVGTAASYLHSWGLPSACFTPHHARHLAAHPPAPHIRRSAHVLSPSS